MSDPLIPLDPPRQSLPRPASRRHRFLLAGLLLLQLAAALWLGGHGAFAGLTGQWRTPAPQAMSMEDWQRMIDRDPKAGAHLPSLTLTDSDGRDLLLGGAKRPGGILFVKSCAQCVADKVAAWDQIQRMHPDADLLVVPASSDIETVRKFKERYGVSVRLVVGGADRLSDVCNPYFRPRVYLYGSDGRLTYVQSPAIATEVAFQQADQVLGTAHD